MLGLRDAKLPGRWQKSLCLDGSKEKIRLRSNVGRETHILRRSIQEGKWWFSPFPCAFTEHVYNYKPTYTINAYKFARISDIQCPAGINCTNIVLNRRKCQIFWEKGDLLGEGCFFFNGSFLWCGWGKCAGHAPVVGMGGGSFLSWYMRRLARSYPGSVVHEMLWRIGKSAVIALD